MILSTSNRFFVQQILHNLALKGHTHVAIETSNQVLDQNWWTHKERIGLTYVSRDHWDYQQNMHQYLHAKLKVLIQSATEKTVEMINKEPNNLLLKWVKGN